MLCYRDMSFCSSSPICARTQCSRHFGEQQRAGYDAWVEQFKGNDVSEYVPGIAWSEFRSDTCGFIWNKKGDY